MASEEQSVKILEKKAGQTRAQFVDWAFGLIALVALLVAVATGLSMTRSFISADAYETLRIAKMVVLGPAMVWLIGSLMVRRTRLGTSLMNEIRNGHTGFAYEVFRSASVRTFFATVILMIILKEFAPSDLGLSTDFYLKALLVFAAGMFSLTFFLLIRDDGDGTEDLGDKANSEIDGGHHHA
ncbi:MAG: hypothetical protein COB37_12000 [Kordiimonadales bacterium]|nr:MAG: hypothetical protein COB37_12000 [Kordiimonadales bacterium]